MLDSFKTFFANQGLGADFSAVSQWAKRSGHAYKRARDVEGFAVDGRFSGLSWRLEWGPTQRDYVAGSELRIRMELGLPHDLQLLLLARPLLETLERQAYEQFTQNNQTEMGDATPEEVRWLVLFPKIELKQPKIVRARFGGVSSLPADGPSWLAGPLSTALVKGSRRLLADEPPFVLMTSRGRAYLRLQLESADVDDIAEALELFEVAATAAQRVAATRPSTGEYPTTTPDWRAGEAGA